MNKFQLFIRLFPHPTLFPDLSPLFLFHFLWKKLSSAAPVTRLKLFSSSLFPTSLSCPIIPLRHNITFSNFLFSELSPLLFFISLIHLFFLINTVSFHTKTNFYQIITRSHDFFERGYPLPMWHNCIFAHIYYRHTKRFTKHPTSHISGQKIIFPGNTSRQRSRQESFHISRTSSKMSICRTSNFTSAH